VLPVMVLCSCIGCEAPQPVAEDAGPSQAVVIVVPGYYGTKLVRVSDGSEVWIDRWEALFRRRSLRVPLPGMGFDGALNLRPGGILQRVNVIPLIYSVMGYGSLLDALQHSLVGRGEVVPLAYDWRLDLMDAVRELGTLVDQLRGHGKYPVAIVAHSMGGLIAGYYLRYGVQDLENPVENWEGATKVDAVVMAGVPFLGAMTTFRNMQYGVRVGLNRSLLEQQAVASFPASYYLLPVSDTDVLLMRSGRSLHGRIRDGSNWKEYGWGLLKDARSLPKDVLDRRSAYTDSWLRQAGRFSELLLAAPETPSRTAIPLLYLSGMGHRTLAKGVWLNQDSPKSPDRLLFEEDQLDLHLPSADPGILFRDGDGTVTLQSSSLPRAYGYAFHVTSRERNVDHAELVGDPDIQQDIVEFLAVRQIGSTGKKARLGAPGVGG
jgi:pimeloyl-ACP methyl ester carboxylesterase